MVKIKTDVRFDITPVEEWPNDEKDSLVNSLITYVDRELTVDVERALKFISLAEKHKLWKFVGKNCLQSMFDSCDLTIDAIEQYRRGAQLLRAKGHIGPIGKDQAKSEVIRQLRNDNPDWTQQRIANEVGCTQGYVARVITEKFESNDLVIPDHLKAKESKADFRKLPEALQQQVADKKISLNAAAIKVGIRKKKTSLEQILILMAKLKFDDIMELREIMEANIHDMVMETYTTFDPKRKLKN